jgi:hypothetical protein
LASVENQRLKATFPEKLTMQAKIFRNLADSTNRIARNLKIAALDLRTLTVQYFAGVSNRQEKFLENQNLGSGANEKAKSHAQVALRFRQNMPYSQSATLSNPS